MGHAIRVFARKGMAPPLRAFAMAFLVTISPPVAFAGDSPEERTALEEDGLFVEIGDDEAPVPNSIYISAVVDAPSEPLWATLYDFGRYDRFLPFVLHAGALPVDDHSLTVDFLLDVPWPLSDVPGTARIEARPAMQDGTPSRSADWRVLTGPMAGNHGSLQVRARPDGRSEVAFLYIKSGPNSFPEFLTRWAIAWTVPDTLAHVRDEARRRGRGEPRTPTIPRIENVRYTPGADATTPR